MRGRERIQSAFKPLIPLPPNPNFDLGEGREGGKKSPQSIPNHLQNCIHMIGHIVIPEAYHFMTL
jgi:hypothetical protein